MKRNNRNAQSGFTLVEIIIVMAIIGVAIAGMLYYQSRMSGQQKANDAVNALVTMIGSIRSSIGGPTGGVYDSVTNANLVSAGIVSQPFTGTGSTITDPWGNTATFVGSGAYFGFQVQVPDSDTCMKIVSALSRDALKMTVGSDAAIVGTATTADTMATGTNVAKNLAATTPQDFDPTNAVTGCSATSPKIAAVFR